MIKGNWRGLRSTEYDSTLTIVFPISEIVTKKENKKIQHVGDGQQESHAAYRWSNGMEKLSTVQKSWQDMEVVGYAEWDVLMLSVVTGLIASLYLRMSSAAVAKRDRPVHRQSAAGLPVILLLLGLWRNMFEHYHTNSQRGDT